MSEKRFPPRLFVVLKVEKDGHHTYIAHGSKWISEYGEIKEYLSLTEHQHILAENEKRIERLREALEGLLYYWTNTPCRFDHDGNCQAHSCFGYDKTCSVADARAALQEGTK